MLIGYMRVSKNDGSQVFDLQKDALLNAGVEEKYIFQDAASGRNDARPGLEECLKFLRAGDTLVIWKLDRLGRTLKHLIELGDSFSKRDVGLKILTGQGAMIDTTSPHGKLMFGIFSAFAEFERELISERTKAGLSAARARGKPGGRPPKITKAKLQMIVAAMSDRDNRPVDIAKDLGVTHTTLYKYVNGDGSLKERGTKIMARG